MAQQGKYSNADVASGQAGAYSAADVDHGGADQTAAAPVPQTTMQKIFGVDPVSDTLGSVGTHLKNIVAGPYHAFTDAPRNPEEQAVKGTDENSGVVANALGQFGLGAARMFVQPTRDALKESSELRKMGGPESSLLAPSTYDEQGNNVPTAGSKLVDGIPIFGPWARGAEDEAHQKGFLPAAAGVATDVLAPKYIGKGMASGLKAAAPLLAERALRTLPVDRAHEATPGRFLLDRTKGFSPEDIESSGRDSMNDLRAQQTSLLGGSTGMVDLDPARMVAGDYGARAVYENHPGTIKDIKNLATQLDKDHTSGQPIPQQVTPLRAASLNRGISNAHGSWNPATVNDTMSAAAGEIHHTIGEGIASVVPEVRPINQELQSGGSVLRRAAAAQLKEGVLGRTISRIGAHTGALTGAFQGYAHGGVPGMIAGLVGPELLMNPDFQVAAARGANAIAPTVGKVSPFVTGAAVTSEPETPKKRPSPFVQ